MFLIILVCFVFQTFFIGVDDDDDDEQSDFRKESSSGKTEERNNRNKIKSRDSLQKRAKKRKQEMAEQRLEVNKVELHSISSVTLIYAL